MNDQPFNPTNHPIDGCPFTGEDIYALAADLFPIFRSITGNGVRQTHDVLRKVVPELVTKEVPTGTQCFDWTIPDEWNVEEAYIATLDGRRIIDIADTNMHLMSYSTPVDKIISRQELHEHLITNPDQPEAIPYVTSYFTQRWAFCVTETQRQSFSEDQYRVVIRSTLAPGSLTYGEILVPGELSDEILIHTYTCHPSMGNNETSGMAVTAYLARAILDAPKQRYSYRIVFAPETIGAVAYISMNLEKLKRSLIAGFVVTCVGDNRSWSFIPARTADSLPERAVRHVFDNVLKISHVPYTFLNRGSDERQYCAPGVDLPVIALMRSKPGTYPEYHTSLDDLTVISPKGLWGGFFAVHQAISIIENNEILTSTVLCEPWLAPRGLRAPLKHGKIFDDFSKNVSNLLAYSDGTMDLLSIADLVGVSFFDLMIVVKVLKDQGLLATIDDA